MKKSKGSLKVIGLPMQTSKEMFQNLGLTQANFYAIKNLADGNYLEIAYNLRSKKEVAKVMRQFLQPLTEMVDYSQMTDRDFLRYIKTQMLDRWTLESSKVMFDWSIFDI
jgi:hypothetical protein